MESTMRQIQIRSVQKMQKYSLQASFVYILTLIRAENQILLLLFWGEHGGIEEEREH